MKNAESAYEVQKQADLLIGQVTKLRLYLEDDGGGMWKDIVKTELTCMLERLAIIKRESVAEYDEQMAS